MLHLVSVSLSHADPASREAIWAAVVEISVRLEKADAFTIDSTTQAGRTKHDAAHDARLLRSLGLEADDQSRGLLPIDGHTSTLARLGPRVLSISLYAGRAWVSGISDWGDEVDALFEDEALSQLLLAIERLHPTLDADVIEAKSRPTLPA